MSLETRIKHLESRTAARVMQGIGLSQLSDADILRLSDAELEALIAQAPFDLRLLTDTELSSLDAWLGEPKTDAPLPPEVEEMLERVKR